MLYNEPLKKGQEVFLKRPIQVYATVIGPSESGSAEGSDVYCVQLQPLTQSYRLEDLEPSERPVMRPTGRLDLHERAREINGLITRRAYELFESRGSRHGHDREDWSRAQSEILMNVPVEIGETETGLTVRAEVPGFTEENLQVQVADRSVCLTGKRQERTQLNQGTTVYSDRRPDQIFRVLELPHQVDPGSVELALSGGILEIKVSKSDEDRKIIVFSRSAAA